MNDELKTVLLLLAIFVLYSFVLYSLANDLDYTDQIAPTTIGRF